jgi:Tol biopolymer transport system component
MHVAWKKSVVAIAIAAIAAVLAAPASPTSTFTGENGRVVYEGPNGLWLVNPNVAGRIRIPGTSAATHTPAWSPDGTKLAFQDANGGDFDIFVMNGDGSGRQELTFSRAFDGDPMWSPDGTRLTFESTRNGNSDVFVIGADGSDETRITTNAAFDGDPSFSADGRRIVFTSERDGNKEIYIMNADGSGQKRLTSSPGIDADPAWSPEGSKIAFESERNGNLDVYTMNPDGSSQTRVTNFPALDALPAWSPDGSKIVYASDRAGRDNRDIWTMNADGSGRRRLTTQLGVDSLPDWQSIGPRPGRCTIWGTPGRDLLVGTPRADRICGLGGNDTIDAKDRRRDVVDGGPGLDRAIVDRRLDRLVRSRRSFVARHVDVAGAKRPFLARLGVEHVPPDAAGVVREQVDRHRRLRRRRPDAVDVVGRRDEGVEVARTERALLDELERAAPPGVDLLVLGAAVQADEPPGEVVVDRRLRRRRHDEREQRQRPVAGAVEQPLADAAAHAALRRRGLVLGRKPVGIGEQLGEAGANRVTRFLRRQRALDRSLDVPHEVPNDGRVEEELAHARRS